jgi:hypothetical protein
MGERRQPKKFTTKYLETKIESKQLEKYFRIITESKTAAALNNQLPELQKPHKPNFKRAKY